MEQIGTAFVELQKKAGSGLGLIVSGELIKVIFVSFSQRITNINYRESLVMGVNGLIS